MESGRIAQVGTPKDMDSCATLLNPPKFERPSTLISSSFSWLGINVSVLSFASKVLLSYGALMWAACGLTYILSLDDLRTIRDVGIWIKPMKFMAATALFAWSTVWLTQLANQSVSHGEAYKGICTLLVVTSLFEVLYITYQAFLGEASHYNRTDALHAFLYSVMGIVAVGLTASQAWLAWEIWKARGSNELSVTGLGVVIGLALTFVLATVSGGLLGGIQPPSGQGLPFVGWHLYEDIRPSHFLGVHAQQLIPLLALLAVRFLGNYAALGLVTGSIIYVMAWTFFTWASLSSSR